ncbi:MAG TPA: type I methionyl aminopeptidase [Chthoniobacteraceae bacterium]|nr:type I methionyl aminopeptidase [Chthoniobacteraceae bacterium]
MSIPIKKPKEIEKMREACRLAGKVLEYTASLVKPGVTTGEIDKAAAAHMAELGCKSAFLGYRGFPGNICISVNDEVVHGIPGSRKVQYGDVVALDVGVIKDGWYGDNALTVAVGMLEHNVQQLLNVTQNALMMGIAAAREGNRVGDISASIEEEVVANGFSVVRDLVGHGVGKTLHEDPQIPNFGRRGTKERLKAGMTLAIEPMVNMGTASVKTLADRWTVVTADSKPSAHFEHTILITKGEPEILTWREKTL